MFEDTPTEDNADVEIEMIERPPRRAADQTPIAEGTQIVDDALSPSGAPEHALVVDTTNDLSRAPNTSDGSSGRETPHAAASSNHGNDC